MRKLLAFCLAASFVSAAAQDKAVVLSRARGAINLEAAQKALRDGGVTLSGKADFLGTKGSYSLLVGGGGEFLEEIRTELPQTTGWDGKTGWSVDWTKMPRVLELEDLESEQAIFWVISGYWLAKDSPFEMDLVPASNPPQIKVRMRSGILEATVFLDENYRATKMVRQSSAGDDVYQFSNYTKQMGFYMPTLFSIQSGGITHTFTIDKITKAPTFVRNPYEPLLNPPKDVTFDASLPASVESKRAFSGHMLVHPKVNGKDVGWFIFDTGAGSMVIDPKVADELKLSKIGKIPAVGVGGVVEASFRKAESITLGPMTYREPTFIQIDLEAISRAFGVKIAGIVGYDLISRAAVEVSFKYGTVALYDASSYKLAKGDWQGLVLDGKHPVVKARFEGDREGLFRLDTGANNALAFHTPAVERYKLLEGRETRESSLGGVGGEMTTRTGKLAWFEIGGKKFENQIVDFSLSKIGPLADKYTVGNIGQRFLLPFTIVFDYAKRRIAFMPNEG